MKGIAINFVSLDGKLFVRIVYLLFLQFAIERNRHFKRPLKLNH